MTAAHAGPRTTVAHSGLYPGVVVHRRRGRVEHGLRQRTVMALFDLDELPVLDRGVTGFGVDRAAPVAFRSRDHGPATPDATPADLRAWLADVVASQAPGDAPDVTGAVRILSMPRVLGYAFDPLSVWFAHDRGGRLSAVVHEIRNTFGQRHAYVVADPLAGATATATGTVLRHRADKAFHVSPFFAVDGTYDFTLRVPDDVAAVGITHHADDGHVLTASFAGRRRAFTTAGLWREMLRHPLLPHAVTAGIHLHAGALWGKGADYHPVPEPRDEPVTGACPVTSHHDRPGDRPDGRSDNVVPLRATTLEEAS